MGKMKEIDEYLLTDETIKAYFSRLYRGMYYVQTKVNCVKFLKEKGYTHERIAELVLNNKDRHDTISHYLNTRKQNQKAEEACLNWKQWIVCGIYPESRSINIYSRTNVNRVRERRFSTMLELCGTK